MIISTPRKISRHFNYPITWMRSSSGEGESRGEGKGRRLRGRDGRATADLAASSGHMSPNSDSCEAQLCCGSDSALRRSLPFHVGAQYSARGALSIPLSRATYVLKKIKIKEEALAHALSPYTCYRKEWRKIFASCLFEYLPPPRA